jgi:hypothetical protein
MAHETRVTSTLRDRIPGGANTYRDTLDGQAQLVHVEYSEGRPWVEFHDVDDEDRGLLLDGLLLAGKFDRTL